MGGQAEVSMRIVQGLTFEVGPHAYRTLRKLGQGGCGEVWLAQRVIPGLETPPYYCAIKFIDAAASEAVERERRAGDRVRSPFVVRFEDFGRTPDGQFDFIVMEYCPDGDLKQWIKSERFRSTIAVLQFVTCLCEGLRDIHSARLVHRDIKPQNVLISRTGPEIWPKWTDFGFARQYSEESQTTEHPGTVPYMPPEFEPQTVPGRDTPDRASDVFSLGVLIVELLTESATAGPNMTWAEASRLGLSDAIKSARRACSYPSLRHNARLWQFLEKALQPDARERHCSAEELVAGWQGVVDAQQSDSHFYLFGQRALRIARLYGRQAAAVVTAVALATSFTWWFTMPSPARAATLDLKPYWIPTVTMYVRLRGLGEEHSLRGATAEVRNSYSVQVLRPGAAQFREWFGTSVDGAVVSPWPAPGQARSPSTSYATFAVAGRRREIRSIFTGASITYPPAYDGAIRGATAFSGRLRLGAGEHTFEYPNDSGEEADYIGELLIVVDSPRPFSDVHEGSVRYRSLTDDHPLRSAATSQSTPDGRRHVVSTRWRDVRPGEHVGLVFRWAEPGGDGLR